MEVAECNVSFNLPKYVRVVFLLLIILKVTTNKSAYEK